MATLEDAKEICREIPEEDLGRLSTWITIEERPRREQEREIGKARAEDAAKLWEAHPELKPEFETGTVEVTPTTKDGRITLAALLKAYPPFVQPTGAHDALPPGAQVSDEGRIWRNDLDKLNVWKPGTMNAGWTDITDMLLAEHNPPAPESEPETDGAETEVEAGEPTAPAVQEWAPNIDVTPGERYRFQGDTYEVIQAHTSAAHWPPNAVPALYRKV